jgi:hypothetical protein
MDPKIWSQLPWELIERIAHFADIDSRRALGFLPRRLSPSELTIRTGTAYSPFYTEPFTRVNINEKCNIIASENGEVSWRFGPENCFRVWKYYRDGKPMQVVEFEGATVRYTTI